MSQSPHSSDDTPIDVLIAGGGVAGGALGAVLAERGLSVAIVERAPRFQDRIRGEYVHPWGVRELQALGLYDTVIERACGLALPKWTRYTDTTPADPYEWASDFPNSAGGLSVPHPRLQQTLLDLAAERGAAIYRPARLELGGTPAAPEIIVASAGSRLTLRPHLLVGADGQRSAVRRWIGGQARRDPVHHAIGGALFTGVSLPRDSAHQAFFDGGFAMAFPRRDGATRVYYVCSTSEANELQRQPDASLLIARAARTLPAGALDGARSIGPIGFFPNADLVADRLARGRVVLIGDAAGANDPSLGHGLSLVFRDVRELRDLLTGDDDRAEVPEAFASRRLAYYAVLREHAKWQGMLVAETGPAAEARRTRVARAREIDPGAGGFAALFAAGPDGLAVDEHARRHFFGEDLPE